MVHNENVIQCYMTSFAGGGLWIIFIIHSPTMGRGNH